MAGSTPPPSPTSALQAEDAAYRRFASLFKQMIRTALAIERELAGEYGLAVTDLMCLTFLDESDSAANAKMVAEHVNLSTGATTALIDRLERDGFVVRRPNPADRRSVIIELVNERVDPLLANFEELRYRLKRAYSGLSKEEAAAVTRFMQTLLEEG